MDGHGPERTGRAMPKPTQSGALILQISGIMVLVGAMALAVGEKLPMGLAILPGVAGSVFFVLAAMTSR